MSSQLNDIDKQRLLRGITKKIGDKPYENGYWGEGGNADRDYVLVELLDEAGNLIEYRDIVKYDAIEGINENFIKLSLELVVEEDILLSLIQILLQLIWHQSIYQVEA